MGVAKGNNSNSMEDTTSNSSLEVMGKLREVLMGELRVATDNNLKVVDINSLGSSMEVIKVDTNNNKPMGILMDSNRVVTVNNKGMVEEGTSNSSTVDN